MAIYIEKETETEFDFQDVEGTIELAVNAVFEDKDLPDELDVNVLIVGAEEIREINRENRGIDSTTDVLSFPYFEYEVPGEFDGEIYEDMENILGDIILCADRIISQAEEYGHSQKRELAFLVVHSMLHLTGYDHIEESDGDIMRAQEKRIMEIIGISR